MILHAGSLYKDYLVLKGGEHAIIIKVDNPDLQWEMYCNDVEFEKLEKDRCKITFKGKEYLFPYIISDNPMKTLGF